MDFARPLILLLFVPWAILIAAWYLRQRRSLRFLGERVAPRFIGRFTEYRGVLLPAHAALLFAAGALLVIAAAGPLAQGRVRAAARGDTVVFVIDASISMVASDTQEIRGAKKPASRLEEAALIARGVMRRFPDHRFGLVTFSGVAAYHAPPTIDHAAVSNYLKTLRIHMFEKTGTDFSEALGAVVHLAEGACPGGMQAVLIGDGEENNGSGYDAALAVLKRKGIPVHTVGVGTIAGGGVDIFNPRDLLEGKPKPGVIRSIATKRVEAHLKTIAAETGGAYLVIETGDTVYRLCQAIRRSPRREAAGPVSGRKDLSPAFIIAFAVLFLADLLVFDGLGVWRGAIATLRERLRGGGA